MIIRTANNQDCDGIIRLVDSVYGEYNDRVCLEGAEADLTDVESHFIAAGGMFWVLDDGGQIVGSHAVVPLEQPAVCQFKRLYLDESLRGSDWGHELMQVTIDWARESGFQRVEFWSDTRFSRAHRFFEKFNFQRDGRVREMLDGIDPYQEYFYSLNLVD